MFKKLLVFSVTILCSAVFAASVQAEFQVPLLDQVASAFASRPVFIKCKNGKEDSTLSWAAGYVYTPASEQKFATLRDYYCLGALAIDLDNPEFDDNLKSFAAGLLVHEAYHLKRVRYNENEAWTECRAMRHYDIVLYKLGAEPETIDRLMPIMLSDYYTFGMDHPEYLLKGCKRPARYSKWFKP